MVSALTHECRVSDSGPYKQTGPVGVMGRTRQIQACASLSHVDMYFVYVDVSNWKYYCFVTNVMIRPL